MSNFPSFYEHNRDRPICHSNDIEFRKYYLEGACIIERCSETIISLYPSDMYYFFEGELINHKSELGVLIAALVA